MTTQPFELYRIVTTNGRYGEVTKEVLIDIIDVAISQQHMKLYTYEMQYYIKVKTGLTSYQNFTVGENYFISDGNTKYEIQSFIVGRWTQLQLKQVIA